MIKEAPMAEVASGLAPISPGWFVVNARDAAWTNNDEFGGVCIFESDEFVLRGRPELPEYVKPEAGFTLRVVPPGKPNSIYHAESVQEDFLILHGECLLVIEDEERRLGPWDFVHCPPNTGHTFVNVGDTPCIMIATGSRRDDLERTSPHSEVALRHNAGAEPGNPQSARRGTWEVRRPAGWGDLPWAHHA